MNIKTISNILNSKGIHHFITFKNNSIAFNTSKEIDELVGSELTAILKEQDLKGFNVSSNLVTVF